MENSVRYCTGIYVMARRSSRHCECWSIYVFMGVYTPRDAKGVRGRAQLRAPRWLETNVLVTVPWQGGHGHQGEDSLGRSQASHSGETTKASPVEIPVGKQLAMPVSNHGNSAGFCTEAATAWRPDRERPKPTSTTQAGVLGTGSSLR